MEEICETVTVIRTFDREISRLKSAAESVRWANGGVDGSGHVPAAAALPRDSVEGAYAPSKVSEPATTISAALGGCDAIDGRPTLRFLGGSDPGPDGFRIGSAASSTGHDLRTLLLVTDLPLSSFVPDHGLCIIIGMKTPNH